MTSLSRPSTMPVQLRPVDVREELVRALRLDVIGPEPDRYREDALYAAERLPVAPSRWYLTGFLVPFEASVDQRTDETSQEEVGLGGDEDDAGADENVDVDAASARKAFFPSSLGVSVLVNGTTTELTAEVTWGDYRPEGEPPVDEGSADAGGAGNASTSDRASRVWARTDRREVLTLGIPGSNRPAWTPLPNGDGLKLVVSARPVNMSTEGAVPAGTRAVAVFLVNERSPAPDTEKDRAFAFQAALTLGCDAGFVPRPNPRGGASAEWDERVADLQYRDVVEFAVGHGVSVAVEMGSAGCQRVATTWAPRGEVEVVEAAAIEGAELGMEALADAPPVVLRAMLQPIVERYGTWIELHRTGLPSAKHRREIAEELLRRADLARERIAKGIALLARDDVRLAFQLANRAMAAAARRRAVQGGRAASPETVPAPSWRPFQLAFVLLNLRGVVEPESDDRGIVDLLFFPTGGGKTEAYLGLAAFTLLLRRLRNPGLSSAGVSVLMRYTLRLLTLDQLSRAATLICALELLRKSDPALGPWPFEIGLWVGRAATPNRMGKRGDPDEHSARKRVIAYKAGKTSLTPIPLEACPWCGTAFSQNSFQLVPNEDRPIDLRVVCVNRSCEFRGNTPLPVVTVDEPIYRRLPCFIIATVDKFAALPWVGQVGGFFGRVDRHDANGFYGPCDPGEGTLLPTDGLLPPDLIIQDELHLISGPLGTVAGLYEAAIDQLSEREVAGKRVRPKIVASTATVRRADRQIRALFGRDAVEIFPPASIDRRDSFFAQTALATEKSPRLYLGLAAPGRSLKVLMLRTYLALLGAGQRAYDERRKARVSPNPADPYMTLLGYFNALRELGGSRRIVEDEVNARLWRYSERRRVDESRGLFADRVIKHEVVELTSREPTGKVSEYKQRLALPFTSENEAKRVDVALATNMISVGLDITRLGMMVVLGQPKASAEYIQATSRVGRDVERPGLVVTLLNVHKPRDRSHFERFTAYHETFYRSVEATSVTPFAARAVDRSLAAVVVGLARQGLGSLTAPRAAGRVMDYRSQLGFVVDSLARRAEGYGGRDGDQAEELRLKVRGRVQDLLDSWEKVATGVREVGAELEYQREEGSAKPLLFDPLDPELARVSMDARKFKAHRSMRDVEPEVALWIRRVDGSYEEEDAE